MGIFETIIIAIVEGLTEFLPVSSTGHMIIAQNLLGVESTEFVKAFTFIIQFGAILSVVVLYWKRFFQLNHTPAPEGSNGVQPTVQQTPSFASSCAMTAPRSLSLIFSRAVPVRVAPWPAAASAISTGPRSGQSDRSSVGAPLT